MSYDEQCYVLAVNFLGEVGDDVLSDHDLHYHADKLAQDIQKVVEDYIQMLKDKKELP